MLTLIAIRIGHKLYLKHKAKKLYNERLIILSENKKNKKLSIYKHMIREKKTLRKLKLPKNQRKYV